MAVILKKKLGNAGAGIDDSYDDTNTLYDVVEALVDFCADVTAKFNTLKAEYDAETLADHTNSAAADLVVPVTKE
jgi:hypothetical protein